MIHPKIPLKELPQTHLFPKNSCTLLLSFVPNFPFFLPSLSCSFPFAIHFPPAKGRGEKNKITTPKGVIESNEEKRTFLRLLQNVRSETKLISTRRGNQMQFSQGKIFYLPSRLLLLITELANQRRG